MLQSKLTSNPPPPSNAAVDSRPSESNTVPNAPLVSSPETTSSPLNGEQQVLNQLPHHTVSDPNPTQGSDSVRSSLDIPFNPSGALNSHALLQQNTAVHQANAHHTPSIDHPSTLIGGLHIRTDVFPQPSAAGPIFISDSDYPLRQSTSTASLPRRTPSIRAALAATHSAAGSLSPGSAYSSPQLAAMADITPLPSPIGLGTPPWKSVRLGPRSRTSSTTSRPDTNPVKQGDMAVGQASPPKKRTYHGLRPPTPDSYNIQTNVHAVKENEATGHARNRSLSEYVPEAVQVPKQRVVTVAGSAAPPTNDVPLTQSNLHREEYLAVQRGLTLPTTRPPTPPRSTQSGWESGSDEKVVEDASIPTVHRFELFIVGLKRYRVVRQLGQGTFSRVMLALKEDTSDFDRMDYAMTDDADVATIKSRSKKLVAVKVVQHGPAGGADAERIETSLSREIEILRSIDHPSLVHLKAFANEERRSLLVLNFCPGGDLFELASLKNELLNPELIQRIFSELVSAVLYLHSLYIVHRDIKLENVLLNLPLGVLPEINDWYAFNHAVVVLTDLGLSRRIPPPPESPLLQTRCGSEDYAAPELLMGQPYDGRATDAWALGVLIYSLMEGRLPFDPLPGARGDPAKLRARTPHRIARCEWSWYKFADADGEWDPSKGKSLEGGRLCVDGLLKRNTRRKSLNEIAEMEWVKEGVRVPEGLKRIEEV